LPVSTYTVRRLGYDIRTESGYDEMMHDLGFIGLNYLKAVHVNDSRGTDNSTMTLFCEGCCLQFFNTV